MAAEPDLVVVKKAIEPKISSSINDLQRMEKDMIGIASLKPIDLLSPRHPDYERLKKDREDIDIEFRRLMHRFSSYSETNKELLERNLQCRHLLRQAYDFPYHGKLVSMPDDPERARRGTMKEVMDEFVAREMGREKENETSEIESLRARVKELEEKLADLKEAWGV